MYTTLAWYEAAAKTLEAINAVKDEHVTVSEDDITIPIGFANVIAALLTGSGLSRARLSSPSLRRIWLEELNPFASNISLIPGDPFVGIIDRMEDPIPLTESEKLNILVTTTTSACAVIFLGDGPITRAHGDIRTIRADASIADVAGSWESGPLSFSQTLPAGRYQVVGMRVIDAHGIAARLLFVGEWARPGCVCAGDVEAIRDTPFRLGNPGALGEFEFDQPPQLEILSDGTGTSQEVFLDVIQVRAGRS